MVEGAVTAATADAVTAGDVESAISKAVEQSQESSDALTADEVQSIVAKALEARAMMEEPPRDTSFSVT